MPTYALLGATGSTGAAILRCLILHPPVDLTLNILVRNKAKLLQLFPGLETTTTTFKALTIIEGTPSDATLMQTCLHNVDVAMACIATNYSTPDVTICVDTATAIIAALKFHQQNDPPNYKPPTIIQLRSASVNPTLKAAMPWLAQTMAGFCFHYVYEDIRRASTLFISDAGDSPASLLHYIFVDPPAIHDPEGVTPTGYALIVDGKGKQESAISYADLGASFCELAGRRDEFRDMEVGPTATGEVKLTVGLLLPYVIAGFKGRVMG